MKQDILSRIDEYFEQKSQNERYILSFGVIAVIAYLLYIFSFDASERFYNEQSMQYEQISKELKVVQNYIKSVSSPNGDQNFKIKEQSKELEALKKTHEELLGFNNYFDDKLKELSFLLFNDQNWATFLDRIVILAKENNIKILELNNEFKNPSYQKVEQILNINVKLLGSYQNMLNYINSLEESELVVDLHKIDINATQKELGANIAISIWGMKY
ncbi:type 4a pilus biogenesis protein PilO [Campylobacter sp. RM13119]|uniref:type 4a pilus biogenesis protein PilO n=1 Tax=Campylobacter californiensis TaxID=1032243 RepID=UPI001475DFB5|nr:type 4a pilus biogenesis protein PilO [Campylobacter sp. RM13119]MBE3605519.1 type 4a pilus biogenesis protein PilO [Campylobacter sp. RM13119]